ncbi:MAG TPA: FAD-dependent oxidoreductase [Actinomycetota bacterium]
MSGQAVVVGAGAIGVASAHSLAEAGFAVTLVDRAEVGRGCSFANAGLIVPGHSQALAGPGVIAEGLRHLLRRDSPFTIRPRPDPALVRWLLAFRRACGLESYRRTTAILTELSQASLALFDDLVRRGEADFGYRSGPLINAYTTEGWRGAAAAFAEELEGLGIGSRQVDAVEARELEPALSETVTGALLIEGQASGDCHAYVRSLAERLSTRGAATMLGRAVRRVAVRGGRAAGVVLEDGEEVPADLVVLAAGAWTPRLTAPLGLRLPIQPATGYSDTLPAWPGAPRTPIIFDDTHVVVLPLEGRVRFAGTLELAGFRTAPDPVRYHAVVRAGRRALRDVPPGEGEAWFGFRPLMPDDLPAIGWVPWVEGAMVAAGHGTLGFTQSPITGRLVAELATGKVPTLDVTPFRPDRF